MSGSRKSSLAFDTIYAEGQRRLLASMSTFAKRFVGQLKKPDVDFVTGLSPVVSIDQKTVGSNPRSTVGTMTDISDYLRMLFATMGTPHCPLCGEALALRSPHQMMEHLLSLPKGTEVEVRAPVYKIRCEDYDYLFEQIRVNGYRRARIYGKPRDLGEHIDLDEDREHTVEAVIDTFVVGPGIDRQVVTSLEHGLKLGDGLLGFHIVKPKHLGGRHKQFYDGFGCARHRLVAGKKIKFNGVITQLEHHYRQYRKQGTSNAGMDEYLKKVMVEYDCPECGGARLKRARRLVTIGGRNLYDVGQMHLADVLGFLKSTQPTARQRAIAETILREVATRLELLIAIGMDELH